MSDSEKHVAAASKAKSLREALPADDVASFAKDDILLYANVDQSKDLWLANLHDLEKQLPKVAPDEAAALRQVLEAAQDLKSALAGIRLDEGFGSTLSLTFDGDKSRDILTQLQSGGGTNALTAGLPAKRRIAAHAARGHGENTAAIARGLLNYSLLQFQGVDSQQFVTAGHRANLVGVVGEVWQRLEGSRVALYENEQPDRMGHFSLVAILDTDDPVKFITDMTSLARFVNASGFSLDDAAESIDAKTIAELLVQLGDDSFAVRQTASTKLGLVGPAALTALQKAEQADDPEVRFRAKLLRDQINLDVNGEKKDLLKQDLHTRLQPQLVFFPTAERRLDRTIDIVQLRLRVGEVGQAAELRRLLGPDWNKLRLATVGKRVVVLLGSETSLLEQAIASVASDKPSPDDPLRVRLPDDLTAQFHLSLTRTQQLLAPGGADTNPTADPPHLLRPANHTATSAPESVRPVRGSAQRGKALGLVAGHLGPIGPHDR